MTKLPEPFSSPLERFSKAVAILERLIQEKKVRVKSSPGANIAFRVEPQLLTARAEALGLRPDEAPRLVHEVAAMVALLLQERQTEKFFESMIERLMSDEEEGEGAPAPKEREEAKSILSEKARLASKLVSDRIRQKFHAFRASKHDVVSNIRWEVVERKYDKDEKDKARGVAVILKVELTRRPEHEYWMPFFFEDPSRRSFVVECDDNDLDEVL